MNSTKRGVHRLRPRDVSVSVRTPKSPGMKVTDIVEQMPINELVNTNWSQGLTVRLAT